MFKFWKDLVLFYVHFFCMFFTHLCSLFLAFYVQFSVRHLSQASQPAIGMFFALLCLLLYSFWFAFSSLLFSILSEPSQPASHPSQAPATTPASHPSHPSQSAIFAPLCLIFCMFFTHFCSLFFSLLCSLLSQPSQPAIQPPPFSTQLHLPFLIPHSPFSLYIFITFTHYFFNPTITCL